MILIDEIFEKFEPNMENVVKNVAKMGSSSNLESL